MHQKRGTKEKNASWFIKRQRESAEQDARGIEDKIRTSIWEVDSRIKGEKKCYKSISFLISNNFPKLVKQEKLKDTF